MAVNRRQFLAGSGMGAAALFGGALLRPTAPSAAEPPPSATEFDPRSWESVRAQFGLSPDWIHLAGLLLSSHPAPVRHAIERHRDALDDNPPHYLYGGGHGGERAVRQAAAAYMGVGADDVALTGSTTMGLAILYHGLELRPGQEILTTTHDHRVTHEAIRFRAERTGAATRRVPLYREARRVSEAEVVESLLRALRPETRVVALTWVHSSTGVRLPVRALADALARHNAGRAERDRVLLCVDGVHGFGVEDARVGELGCDFFAAGTHKWLFGPRGTGVLWGRPEVQRLVTPTIPTFTRDGSWGGEMTPGGFHAFEHRWALAEAFEFHRRIGPARVAERIRGLNRQLKEGLAAMPHVTLHTPMEAALSSGITCFEVRGQTPGRVVARLRERGIVGSTTPYTPSYARLTPGVFNTPEEVDAALATIRAMA